MNSDLVHFRVRHGFTLIEASMSTVIVASLLALVISSVGSSRAFIMRAGDRARAQEYALDLMSEILQESYQAAASTTTSRPQWTAIDQYNAFAETPLHTKTGVLIADTTGLTRAVSVQWIDPTLLQPTSATNTGLKLITVTVSRGSITLSAIAAYRSAAWDDPLPSSAAATAGLTSPIASAAATPLTGSGGTLAVAFDGSASFDPNGDTLTYLWTFGDGTTATAATASHTYTAAGNYSVTLTVTNSGGATGISSLAIDVRP